MVLLSSAMRASALTGDPEPVHSWFSGRQWGLWAGQWSPRSVAATSSRRAAAEHAAPPAGARPATDPAEALRSLGELHDRGVVTDAEFERLKARVGP